MLDIADIRAVRTAFSHTRPQAVIHLAGVAYAPDAAADASAAIRANVGGTVSITEAIRGEVPECVLLVVSSADVYQPPVDGSALSEASPLGPRGVYGLTKLAGESVALASAGRTDLTLAVARPFNHTGPGQRDVFAVPAFARRVLEARAQGVHEIRAGNVDVARDISDVRDVVRAYRLLLEALAAGRVRSANPIFNVASGRAVKMRSIIESLGEITGWPVQTVTDPGLVRVGDPPVIRGDPSALTALTGWTPDISLDRTLEDLVASLERGAAFSQAVRPPGSPP
jgi:GDP-4-dehydro-6-deoxy-D-mannose reductase